MSGLRSIFSVAISITRAGLLPRVDKEERGVALAHPKHGDALELRGNVNGILHDLVEYNELN